MEQHIIEIVRFAVCIMAILVAIVLVVKADDNNLMRRLAVAFAALLVYCNEQIGMMTYLLIGSTLETLMAAMGVTFVIIMAVVIMILPLVALFRWAVGIH